MNRKEATKACKQVMDAERTYTPYIHIHSKKPLICLEVDYATAKQLRAIADILDQVEEEKE